MFEWNCNICQANNRSSWLTLEREGPSCMSCQSSVRQRQVVNSVDRLLKSISSRRPKVIGISDADLVAKTLGSDLRVKYKNTFFDVSPKLDISAPRRRDAKSAHIVVCSDVLEHVMFPIQKALRGLLQIVKPGGYAVITVPYTFDQPNLEHYPWMIGYEVSQSQDGSWVVIGTGMDGSKQVIENPIFHGGPGNTLEMRLLSRAELLKCVRESGFVNIEFDEQDHPDIGIRMQLGILIAQRPS